MLDFRIEKKYIENKGIGLFASAPIEKHTIILKETSEFILEPHTLIISDMFQLLYKILTSSNPKAISKFHNLMPTTTTNFTQHQSNILLELDKLCSTIYHYIYTYFKTTYTTDELLLLSAKYMCNAFEFGSSPIILFTGAQINHSCLPNVIFKKKGKFMIFYTVTNIKAGEEICDTYVDISLDKQKRHSRLLNQYGFTCLCIRCTKKLNCYDTQIKEIIKLKATI